MMKTVSAKLLPFLLAVCLLIGLVPCMSGVLAETGDVYMRVPVISYGGYAPGDASLFARLASDGSKTTMKEVSAVRLGNDGKDYNYYALVSVDLWDDGLYHVTKTSLGKGTDFPKADEVIPENGFILGLHYDVSQAEDLVNVQVGDVVTLEGGLSVEAAKAAQTTDNTARGTVAFARSTMSGYVVLDAAGQDLTVNDNSSNAFVISGLDFSAAPEGSKLGFWFDTTAIPDVGGERNNWGFYLYINDKKIAPPDNNDAGIVNASYVRIVTRDGVTKEVTNNEYGGEPGSWIYNLPANATGYCLIELSGDFEVNKLSTISVSPEWGWNSNSYGKTIKFRNVGYLPPATDDPEYSGPPAQGEDPGPSEEKQMSPFVVDRDKLYGDNYVVTDDTVIRHHINENSSNNYSLYFNNADAPADAQAIAFYFDTTGIEEIRTDYTDKDSHAFYLHVRVGGTDLSGVDLKIKEKNELYMDAATRVYYWREQTVQDNDTYKGWINTLPVNAQGYYLISVADLQEEAQAALGRSITVADITELYFRVEWNWNEDLYNQDIFFTDIGYVKNVEAFTTAYMDSFVLPYEKGTLEPGDAITVKADNVEGDFAELSWNEYEGANRYLINVYDAEGKYLSTERTRQTSLTLKGLEISTAYKLQIVAVGEEDAILSASNVLDIKTLEENIEAYKKGLLESTSGYTAQIAASGTSATVTWDWVEGVGYYTVHLYEKNGDTLTFVKREQAADKQGSLTFTGLEAGKTYVAQVVSYDQTDSIIFAYEANEFTVTGQGGNTPGTGTGTGTGTGDNNNGGTGAGDNNGGSGDNDGTDSPSTGVAGVGAVALLALVAGGMLVAVRKRRG